MKSEMSIREAVIESIGQQIVQTGCSSGRQTVNFGDLDYEIAWDLAINILD